MSGTLQQVVLQLDAEQALRLLAERAIEAQSILGGRVLLGLAGGPGVGKSTLSGRLVAGLNEKSPGLAALVPMDGFHIRHSKLEALGTAQDKGAPHTFEAAAFVEFLRELRHATEPVSGPGYSRKIEDVVDDAFTVLAETRVLVIEGNYLLLPDPPWSEVKAQLDMSVFIDVSRDLVRQRLLNRHAEEGLFTEARNRAHVECVDLVNYDLVAASRPRADLVIDLITES